MHALFIVRINVSLSSYSSASNKSSLNDSGVVGDQELDSVSEARLRMQQQVGNFSVWSRSVIANYPAAARKTSRVPPFRFFLNVLNFLQEHPQSDDIINCQPGGQNQVGKRPSKIDIPCVVSIGITWCNYICTYVN